MIDFTVLTMTECVRWESVTRPLDRLLAAETGVPVELGISHQTP